jgi:hypothetical protein
MSTGGAHTAADLHSKVRPLLLAYSLTGPFDSAAHRSRNLSQVDIDQSAAISHVLQLLFDPVEGLGAALVPGADGNGHAVRTHAQNGALGRSGHLLHHDRYRSDRREVTYVLAIASHEQAVWQLVRGEARTFVRPPTRRMYLLVFGASANCMAMHGVGDLEQRVWPAGEMYGHYQRYSLSGSAQYVDGAGHSDLLQLLRSQARFSIAATISALDPSLGELVL